MNSKHQSVSTSNAWRGWIEVFLRLISILLVSSGLATNFAQAADVRHVLILNSYHAGYTGSDDLVAGIKAALDKAGLALDTKTEYLDSKQFSGPSHDTLVLETLKTKYRKHRYDLLITTDDYAFDLVEMHRDDIFGKLPVVFAGTNYFDTSRLQGKNDYVGVDESPSFADTLDLILSLHPGTNRVVAIHDDSMTGKLNSQAFHRAAEKLATQIKIDSLAGLQMEDLLKSVKALQPGTIAVYFASNVRDNAGLNISSNDALRSIAAVSPVPIYGGWAFSLGHGIVGGKLIDLYDHGVAAGKMAVRLLQGEAPQKLTGLLPSPNPYMFDHAQLERFKISVASLPPDSRIINRPPSLYHRYQENLLIGTALLLVIVVSFSFVKLNASHRALKRSQEKFASIFRTTPDLIAISERVTGRFIEVNDAFERIMGFTRNDAIGRTSLDLGTWVASEDRQKMLDALGSKGTLLNFETRFKRKNGEVFPVLLSMSLIYIENIACLAISARDITAIKQAESALKLGEERLRLALGAARQDWFDANIQTGAAHVGNEYPRLLGYEPDEFDSSIQNWMENIHPDDVPQVAATLNNVLQSGGTASMEYRRRRKSGEWLWIQSTGEVVEWDADGKALRLTGIHQDISERKAAEGELEKYRHHLEELVESRTVELATAKEVAEAANRAKTAFLANMSHELRTPMTGVLGMIDLARRRMSDAKGLSHLEKAKLSADRLLGVLNDILDLSKIEAERMVLEQVPMQLGDIVENIFSTFDHKATEKGLRFESDLPAALSLQSLQGDPLRLGQILINLVGNAIKFTEQGTLTLRVRSVGETPVTTHVRFEVIDSGIGIQPEAQARLFRSFEQADNSMTRKYGGTGLGLAICKRLVQLMDGEIGVESAPGNGSTFWFVVPIKKRNQHAVPPAPTFSNYNAEQRLHANYAGTRILLVEDEPFTQEVALGLLEDVGLVVEMAENGQQALALTRHSRYALILMDMQMPVMNGVEATQAIRADSLNRMTPILAMTANAFEEDRQICLNAGMNDHIAKPIDPERLFEKLLTWLEKGER